MKFKVTQPGPEGFFDFFAVQVFDGDLYDIRSKDGGIYLGALATISEGVWFSTAHHEDLPLEFDDITHVRPHRVKDRIGLVVSFTKAQQAEALAKLNA
ncbi:MAG: hypothetical protein RLW87_06935 [Alphaproteobacteria bacterium]